MGHLTEHVTLFTREVADGVEKHDSLRQDFDRLSSCLLEATEVLSSAAQVCSSLNKSKLVSEIHEISEELRDERSSLDLMQEELAVASTKIDAWRIECRVALGSLLDAYKALSPPPSSHPASAVEGVMYSEYAPYDNGAMKATDAPDTEIVEKCLEKAFPSVPWCSLRKNPRDQQDRAE